MSPQNTIQKFWGQTQEEMELDPSSLMLNNKSVDQVLYEITAYQDPSPEEMTLVMAAAGVLFAKLIYTDLTDEYPMEWIMGMCIDTAWIWNRG